MTLTRYAVRLREGAWLGNNRGHNYTLGCAGYEIVEHRQARLWHRKADATKAAEGYAGDVIEATVILDG